MNDNVYKLWAKRSEEFWKERCREILEGLKTLAHLRTENAKLKRENARLEIEIGERDGLTCPACGRVIDDENKEWQCLYCGTVVHKECRGC